MTRKYGKWIYHCFKCESKGVVSDPWATRVPPLVKPSYITNSSIPSDAEDLPVCWAPEVFNWVSKYLSAELIKLNGIVSKHAVLYIPTTDGYLSRNFSPAYKGPKYIQRGVAKLYVPRHTARRTAKPETLIVTEDVVSAIKLSSLDYQAVSVLGTHLHPHVAKWAKDLGFESAVVFFDDDNTIVREKTQKARNLLNLTVSKVRSLGTGVDPKDMSEYDLISAIDDITRRL